ncbi:Lrp/AsnC family transcriptional regulator [Nocardia sp. KC 131]|uniref:Lrp/AsnC family transcriptional regulator n=1 Tax=Nocardia arseniciresistens TaxID=3392119 RepID=UPI00398F06D8
MERRIPETPDTGESATFAPISATSELFNERDLDLVNAIQINPRAPWTRIGPSIGVDATTAARRWHHLTQSGLAWTTAYAPEDATIGYAQLRCRPSSVATISELVCQCPSIFSAERVSGRYQFQLSIGARDQSALDDFATQWLGSLPGAVELRMAVGLHLYAEGSRWQPQALDHAQRALLTDDTTRVHPSPGPRRATDDNLVNALAMDARRTAADLAMDTGLSETAVRRRITELTRSGRLRLRCDFAQSAAGWPVSVSFRAQLPAARVAALGAALMEHPEIRLCTAISDTENNILLIEWLSALQDCVPAEARLTQNFPELRINERNVTLRPLKRMGRLLSRTGAAVGYVPPSAWA